MSEFEPGPENTRALRDTLGRFATGVTVITARAPDGPVGITANSFTSVSLDPPLVLWSPAKSSARCAAFCAAEDFAIHVLAADQKALAQHFARPDADFDPALWDLSADHPPLLPQYAARFVCRRFALHEAGDHFLILGQVLRACPGSGAAPLVFAGGQYGAFQGT